MTLVGRQLTQPTYSMIIFVQVLLQFSSSLRKDIHVVCLPRVGASGVYAFILSQKLTFQSHVFIVDTICVAIAENE